MMVHIQGNKLSEHLANKAPEKLVIPGYSQAHKLLRVASFIILALTQEEILHHMLSLSGYPYLLQDYIKKSNEDDMSDLARRGKRPAPG